MTRAASEENLGHDLAAQLLAHPKVFFLVAGVLSFLGLIPGLPTIPFFALALIIGGMGYVLMKTEKTAEGDRGYRTGRKRTRRSPQTGKYYFTPAG